jgi:hypothetical protein
VQLCPKAFSLPQGVPVMDGNIDSRFCKSKSNMPSYTPGPSGHQSCFSGNSSVSHNSSRFKG